MGSSNMAQVEKEERAAGQARGAQSSEEGEQQSPGVQRNVAQAQAHCRANTPGHSQEVIWFINPVPKGKQEEKQGLP